jgi:DNA-binding NarL/FixJ family response regulator
MASPLHLAHADAHSDGSAAGEAAHVLLVESHAAMRRTLRALLESESMRVVAEADTLTGVARQIRAHDPNVLVVDLSARSGASLQSIRWLRDAIPALPIVATTMHDTRAFERAAVEAGACSLVCKDVADPGLPRAIRAALLHDGPSIRPLSIAPNDPRA